MSQIWKILVCFESKFIPSGYKILKILFLPLDGEELRANFCINETIFVKLNILYFSNTGYIFVACNYLQLTSRQIALLIFFFV